MIGVVVYLKEIVGLSDWLVGQHRYTKNCVTACENFRNLFFENLKLLVSGANHRVCCSLH